MSLIFQDFLKILVCACIHLSAALFVSLVFLVLVLEASPFTFLHLFSDFSPRYHPHLFIIIFPSLLNHS